MNKPIKPNEKNNVNVTPVVAIVIKESDIAPTNITSIPNLVILVIEQERINLPRRVGLSTYKFTFAMIPCKFTCTPSTFIDSILHEGFVNLAYTLYTLLFTFIFMFQEYPEPSSIVTSTKFLSSRIVSSFIFTIGKFEHTLATFIIVKQKRINPLRRVG